MKPISFKKFLRTSVKVTAISTALFSFSNMASANWYYPSNWFNGEYMCQNLGAYTLDCGHWYVGGNMGVSHVRDDKNPGTGNTVDGNGPGGSVVAGYQFNSILGGELGYTQYKNSREYSSATTMFAKTEHYAVHLAAVGRYPLWYQWSALGKLGAAYSYAQKLAVTGGAVASASAGSLYWGLGLAYSITPRVDMIGQFAQAVGNNQTGSTDLWSLGFTFAIV